MPTAHCTHPSPPRPTPPRLVLPADFEAFCLLHHPAYERFAAHHHAPDAVARALGDLALHWRSLLTQRDLTAQAWRIFTDRVPHPTTAIPRPVYDVLVLRHPLGYTPDQITRITGIDLHTVRWWLSRHPTAAPAAKARPLRHESRCPQDPARSTAPRTA